MLDTLTNPDLITQILTDKNASLPEIELAYRLRAAIADITSMQEEIGTLTVQVHNYTENLYGTNT